MNKSREDQYHCYSCKTRLSKDSVAGPLQYDNALIIKFEGGYGMFTDNLQGQVADPRVGKIQSPGCVQSVIICHDCAHDLCDKNPWIEQLIDSYHSHAHSYSQDWTGHQGWDLPHKDQNL